MPDHLTAYCSDVAIFPVIILSTVLSQVIETLDITMKTLVIIAGSIL